MNLLKNLRTKIAVVTIGAGMAATAAYADIGNVINVTLPEAATVGDATLPGGSYTITEVPVGGTESLLVFRDENGTTVAVMSAEKIASSPDPVHNGKTEVVLSPDQEGAMHVDQVFIAGEPAGYTLMHVK